MEHIKELPWWDLSLMFMGMGFLVQGLLTVLFETLKGAKK